MEISVKARKAVLLASLCSVSYLAVYIARNLLGAVTPQIIESGVFDESFIGSLSSLYFVCYAVGQLINGAIGDKIKAKYMICFGLFLAGVTNFIFPHLTAYPYAVLAIYAFSGFFLSMIYGPMSKIVSENVDPLYAPRCSLGYTFASFFGSPSAGALAAILSWSAAFTASSVMLALMAAVGFICFTLLEKKGVVRYGQYKPSARGIKNVGVLLKRNIVKFALISIITGIVRTSVVFWLPTYLSQHLGFSSQAAALLFTVCTFVISMCAFIAIFTYEKLGRNMHKTVLIMFSLAAVFFLMTYLIDLPVLNVILIVLAIMSSNCSASVLFSIYCPSLRDTGIVSTATGFLDFISYMGAAIANLVFANAIGSIGWGNLILVWTALMGCGILVSLPYQRFTKSKQ